MMGHLHSNTLLNSHEMDLESRIDRFEGPDVEYIHYLESHLVDSRSQVYQLRQALQGQHHPASPPDSLARVLEDPPNDGSACTSRGTSVQTHRTAQGSTDVNVPDGAVPGPNDECEQLKFIEYDVTKEKLCNQKPQWRAEMDRMLAGVPVASGWVDRREGLELSDNHLALAMLLRRPWMVTPPTDGSCHPQTRSLPRSNGLLHCAETYANATREIQSLAKFATNVALFQELVLVSLCVVLVEKGVGEDQVDPVMKLCWANDKKQEKEPSEKCLERNRRGALWANRCIGKLSEGRWGLRSTEIFLLCKMTLFPPPTSRDCC